MKTIKQNFWLEKKVAVTGASGFLGKHFVLELKKKGAFVKSINKSKCNLLVPKLTTKALKNIDVVINCAALDGNAEYKTRNPAKIMDSNIKIVSNILNASKKNNIKDVVIISSAEIYSPLAPNPIKEEDDYQKFNSYTSNGYILSKRYGEILAGLFSKETDLRIYLPRPTNIYGPKDYFSESSSRVIPNFIKKFSEGRDVEIWGDGTQIRQFIYVKDVIKIILKMVESKHTGLLNIATTETISILDLAKKMYQKFNSLSCINLKLSKGSGSYNRILDTTAMSNLTSFPLVSLEEGLQKTIDWYKRKNK